MSTTTTTATKSKPAGTANRGAKKDPSMKSTWREDKTQWGFFHRMYDLLDIHQSTPGVEAPIHEKTDKVPHVPQWTMHRHLIVDALSPLAIHQAYCWYFGKNLVWWQALIFYTLCFKLIGIHLLHQLRRTGTQIGFLDGDKHARDDVPDHSVRQVFLSLINTSTWRSLLAVFLTYNSAFQPKDAAWLWLPLEQGLYGIILDFWFYWYHRLMHEVDFLWQYHRTHHLTKHPNPLLTLYADFEQEIFDIAGIPLLTWGTMKLMGFPMGFYEWWVCHQYVMFAEVSGHSGLRMHAQPPSTLAWLLKWLDAELIIEDHDLHHRRGYKKSGNYGKQTRLWDKMFGTLLDRVECQSDNIDYVNVARHPVL